MTEPLHSQTEASRQLRSVGDVEGHFDRRMRYIQHSGCLVDVAEPMASLVHHANCQIASFAHSHQSQCKQQRKAVTNASYSTLKKQRRLSKSSEQRFLKPPIEKPDTHTFSPA